MRLLVFFFLCCSISFMLATASHATEASSVHLSLGDYVYDEVPHYSHIVTHKVSVYSCDDIGSSANAIIIFIHEFIQDAELTWPTRALSTLYDIYDASWVLVAPNSGGKKIGRGGLPRGVRYPSRKSRFIKRVQDEPLVNSMKRNPTDARGTVSIIKSILKCLGMVRRSP